MDFRGTHLMQLTQPNGFFMQAGTSSGRNQRLNINGQEISPQQQQQLMMQQQQQQQMMSPAQQQQMAMDQAQQQGLMGTPQLSGNAGLDSILNMANMANAQSMAYTNQLRAGLAGGGGMMMGGNPTQQFAAQGMGMPQQQQFASGGASQAQVAPQSEGDQMMQAIMQMIEQLPPEEREQIEPMLQMMMMMMQMMGDGAGGSEASGSGIALLQPRQP
jgi:hypothetical protein